MVLKVTTGSTSISPLRTDLWLSSGSPASRRAVHWIPLLSCLVQTGRIERNAHVLRKRPPVPAHHVAYLLAYLKEHLPQSPHQWDKSPALEGQPPQAVAWPGDQPVDKWFYRAWLTRLPQGWSDWKLPYPRGENGAEKLCVLYLSTLYHVPADTQACPICRPAWRPSLRGKQGSQVERNCSKPPTSPKGPTNPVSGLPQRKV